MERPFAKAVGTGNDGVLLLLLPPAPDRHPAEPKKASGDGGGGGDLGLGDLEAWGLGDKETTVIQISCTWWGLRHMEPWRFEGMKTSAREVGAT